MYCNKSDVHVTFCRYTESLDAILEEISIYEKHQALLTELDESKALNFLLYGPPGTGKSSLIATLASECSCALYVVNAQAIKPHQLSDLLYPESQSSSRLKLLLFEDFDRFLEDAHSKQLVPQILNALDGVANADSKTVRFFTGNDCKSIWNSPALISRMSRAFKFDPPSKEMLTIRLAQLTQGRADMSSAEGQHLLKLAAASGASMRCFANFVIRHMFQPEPLNALLDKVHELDQGKQQES